MFSASSAQRVEACPPSEVFGQILNLSEAADKGSAGHEHMHLRGTHGVDYAVQQLEETIARWNVEEREASFLRSRLMRFEWSPPKGAVMELRLALMPDFSVQRVPPEQRFYPGAIFTGQFDVMWSEPDPLVFRKDGTIHCPSGSILNVSDYKFGLDSWVHTIEANLQLAIYGFLAARWTGAEFVAPSTIFPGPGQGEWDCVARPWGERQLKQVEQRIRDLLAGVERNKAKLAAGEPLELTEGRHCLYCPARAYCPAKTMMLKRVLDEEGKASLGVAPLSPEERRMAAIALPEYERFARELKELLQADVKAQGVIDLGDGVVWGPEPSTKDEILTEVARSILVDELGVRYANEALKAKISKSSIEEVVRLKHDNENIKRRLKPTMWRIIAKLREAGGIVSSAKETWRAHRPRPQLSDIDGEDA